MKWNINKFLIANTMSKKAPKKVRQPIDLKMSGLVALIAGFSGYAIVSFVSSTNDYVDYMQANVLTSDQSGDVVLEDVVAVNDAGQKSENPFLDLPEDHPNRDAVLKLYYAGVVAGDDYGRFNPDAKVTRAEAVKMILESAKFDLLAYENLENCFGDVRSAELDWFAPHVCAGKEAGYFQGGAEGKFNPQAEITKAEALKMVLTAFDLKISERVSTLPYLDVPADSWYLGVADAANRYGLINDSEIFDAGRLLSRAELAQVIVKAAKL